MAAIESASGYLWLQATLQAASAVTSALPGGIWRGVAKAGSATPYAVVGQQAPGKDIAGVAGHRLWHDVLFRISVWGPASDYAALVTAASAIDTALQRKSGEAPDSSAYISSCVRESTLTPDSAPGSPGVTWATIIVVFRLHIVASGVPA